MRFLSINLSERPAGFALDPGAVVQRLKESFPEVRVDPADPLRVRADVAEARFGTASPAMRTVVEAMRRDAAVQGPAYSFTIPSAGPTVRGVAKRHLIQFGFDDADETLVRRLKDFLLSVVPDSAEADVEED